MYQKSLDVDYSVPHLRPPISVKGVCLSSSHSFSLEPSLLLLISLHSVLIVLKMVTYSVRVGIYFVVVGTCAFVTTVKFQCGCTFHLLVKQFIYDV